jgi:hypothetical protein
MTYRLRLTNEELIRSKKELRRLGGNRPQGDTDDDATWTFMANLMKSV